jgi:hypothetical protein
MAGGTNWLLWRLLFVVFLVAADSEPDDGDRSEATQIAEKLRVSFRRWREGVVGVDTDTSASGAGIGTVTTFDDAARNVSRMQETVTQAVLGVKEQHGVLARRS